MSLPATAAPAPASAGAPDAAPPPWTDPFLLLLAAAAAVLAVVLLWELVPAVRDPWRLNDDMRVWIGVYSNELPAPAGPAAAKLWRRYHTSAPGFLALALALKHIGDPWAIAKWGTLVVLAGAVVPMAVLGRAVAGRAGAVAAAALVLHADVYIDRAAGSMPRAFGIPIAAWMLYALVRQRPRLFLWLMPVAMLFYPPLAFVGTAAGLFWLIPLWRSGVVRAHWPSLARHGVAALLVCALAAYAATRIFEEGRAYTYAEAATLPEFGAQGQEMVPLQPLHETLTFTGAFALRRTMWYQVRTWHKLALLGLCGAVLVLWRRLPKHVAWPCVYLFAGSLLMYGVARAVAFRLYYPDRMFFYSMPVIVTTLWLACWVALAGLVSRWRRAREAGAVLAVASAVALGAPGIAGRTAFRIDAAPAKPLVYAVGQLPEDSLISGPYYLSDTLFALAHRHMYVSFEGMVTFQPNAWAWMKARLWRHLDAYYAADWDDVRPLREDGVTHMIVRLANLEPVEPEPEQIFFEPFASEARRLHERNAPRGFVFADPPPASVVARFNDILIVDLAKTPVSGLD